MALKNSRFVGAEILERGEPLRVNHFRVGVAREPPPEVIPAIPGISILRIPLMSGDIYVDHEDPTKFWQVLQFGIQNLYDPELDEWIRIDTIEDDPGAVELPMSVQRLAHHPNPRVSGNRRSCRFEQD